MDDRIRAVLNPVAPVPDPVTSASTAGEIVKRLQGVIDDFMAGLKPDEEVGAALAAFGSERIISVTQVTAINPCLLVLCGLDESGNRVRLVQHVSRLDFLLLPVPARQLPARRAIGFQTT